MKWIRTGRQIGQAVKNVQRLKQVSGVLAKHGFTDVLVRMNLGKFLPERLAAYAEAQSDVSTAERLRRASEELGPTFVKFGQLLSTRPDLLPEAYIEEFTKLQDNVLPLPFSIVKQVVEKELGQSLESAYASFDPNALAAASVGQVHMATLHTGEKVVVKVQRPEIQKIIDTDVSLLAFMAGLMEKYIPESRIIGPKLIVQEFFRTMAFEIDYSVELNNMLRIAKNQADNPDIVIPKAYKNLCTHKILTLERLEGVRLNDVKAIESAGVNKKKLVEIGARAFFKSVLIDGLFHGDLHGGNLFALPGDRLGVVDFGIVGRLSERSRDQLASIVMSLVTEDYENLCFVYAELGASGGGIDFDGFQREVRNTLSPYFGLSLNEVNAGKVLIEATRIATHYNIKIPGDWMIVFKAILTTEGMGRTLDPNFDLLSLSSELVTDLVKNQYSTQRLTKDLAWIAKDTAALFQILPRQIRWMLKKFNANDYAIEIKSPELADIRRQMSTNGAKLSLSILATGLFIASSLSLSFPGGYRVGDYPLISVVGLALGSLMTLRLLTGRR
jgi:ubiquinone biosynthesis protein